MTTPTVDARAHRQLGIEALLDEQRHAIDAAIAGRDVLVVLPTGAGKSAIYQLTGEVRSGATIVVSPLLALQADQMTSIERSGLSHAVALNSAMGVRGYRRALSDVGAGRAEFVFVAPEQLAKAEVLEALRAAHPSLFTVDEAHCISAWGHDFRPDYLRLGEFATVLGRPPILALTATAAPPVRDEIVGRLALVDPLVVVGDFDRPEIELAVRRVSDQRSKRDAVVDEVVQRSGSGIVYVSTKRSAAELAAGLRDAGVGAQAYHGALKRGDREDVHAQFRSGETPVVVATNAFGMGIDKPDVRFVFHHDIPGSLDAYYQEVGRAGRDGEPSEAVLFYEPRDVALQKYFLGGDVDPAALVTVFDAAEKGRNATTIADEIGRSRQQVGVALQALADADVLHLDGRRRVRSRTTDRGEAIERAIETDATRRRIGRSRLEMMRAYADSSWCRRALLLGYYGQPFLPPCGSCDNCIAEQVTEVSDSALAVGATLDHHEFGRGSVMIVAADRVVVFFDEVGYRTLATEWLADQGHIAKSA